MTTFNTEAFNSNSFESYAGFYIYVNRSKLYSTATSIGDPLGDLMDGLMIYVFPKAFLQNVDGYNEAENKKLWLLEPLIGGEPKIKLSIDGIEYPLLNDSVGDTVTNSIIYYRTGKQDVLSINTFDENNNPITVQPIDLLPFEVIINVNEVDYPSLYSTIVDALRGVVFIVQPTTYKKPITGLYEIPQLRQYIKYGNQDHFGIRY